MSAVVIAQQELAQAFSAGRISWEQYEAEHERLALRIEQSNTAHRRAAGIEAPAPRRAPRKHERQAPSTTRAQYARLAASVYVDPKMMGNAVSLVALIVRWARGRGSCDAFVDQLADELGVSRRTVQNWQRAAERCGYLRVEHVRNGRINDANIYHVLPAALPKPTAMPRRKVKQSRDVSAPSSSVVGVQKTAPHETGDKSPPPLSPQGELSGAPLVAAPVNAPLPCSTTATRRQRLPAGGEVASVVPSQIPPIGGESYAADRERDPRRRQMPDLRPCGESQDQRIGSRLFGLPASVGRRLSVSDLRPLGKIEPFTDEEHH